MNLVSKETPFSGKHLGGELRKLGTLLLEAPPLREVSGSSGRTQEAPSSRPPLPARRTFAAAAALAAARSFGPGWNQRHDSGAQVKCEATIWKTQIQK